MLHEPVDRLTVDVPEDFLGVITQLLALRKGRLEQIVNHGTGWVRLDYLVPAGGLIGFRTELLTETRGTALLHHVFERFEPWAERSAPARADHWWPTGAVRPRATRCSRCRSAVSSSSVRASRCTRAWSSVRTPCADDMDVNPTKEKKLTNIRSSTAESFEKLIPPRPMSLEQALEFIADDECVEVTPASVRVRKVELDQSTRGRAAKRAKALS